MAREWWRAGAGAAAVIALVLGVVGLQLHSPGQSPQDLVYGSLQLFVLESGELGAPPYNVWLEIARFLAPATTAFAVFEALRALMRSELRRRRLARQRGHVIVCGDDVASMVLARNIATQRRVVLVRRSDGGQARRGDIAVVRGDPREQATLRAAGIGGAAALYACAVASGDNAAVVLTAAQLRAEGTDRLALFAQVGDDDLVEALRVRQVAAPRGHRTMVDFFALEDTAARRVLARHALSGPHAPVVIVGSGPFGIALLRALVRTPGTDGAGREVVVHTDDPTLVTDVAAQWGAAERGVTLHVAGLTDPVVHPSERIFVSLSDEEAAVGLALRLLRTPGRRVVACLQRAQPFAEALGGTAGLEVVGVLDEACHPDLIEADAVVRRAARAIHAHYVQERLAAGDTAESNDSVCDWADLPTYKQESNYAQAEHIGVKLRAINAALTTARPASLFTFGPGEVDRLAKLEHRRWVDERRAAGFVWGPHRTDHEHPDLLDWPNLPLDSRQKDIETVEHLPDLLADAGLYIVRLPSGPS